MEPGHRYCRHCGAAHSRAATYCSTCGQAIVASGAGPVANDPPLIPIASVATISARAGSLPTDATFARRLAAGLLDTVIAGIALFVALAAMAGIVILIQGELTSRADAIGSISTELIVPWLYFTIQEASKAQATFGKRACGLRVETVSGERLSFGRASGRWLAKWLTLLTIGVGFLMVTWTKRHQALHDIVAGTLVRRQP